jgi:hypothetical protein
MIYGAIWSEFVYNKHLWALNQISKEFRGGQENQPDMLSNDERDALFRDADALYALSNVMLAQLLKRWESSPQGLVASIADIVEENLHAFDAYLKYCSKERRAIQQYIFVEHRALFGSAFHRFLAALSAKSADLETLVAQPVRYLGLWPVMIRNLMKDTSRTRDADEYNALKRLRRHFNELGRQLQSSSAAVATDLRRRMR